MNWNWPKEKGNSILVVVFRANFHVYDCPSVSYHQVVIALNDELNCELRWIKVSEQGTKNMLEKSSEITAINSSVAPLGVLVSNQMETAITINKSLVEWNWNRKRIQIRNAATISILSFYNNNKKKHLSCVLHRFVCDVCYSFCVPLN